MNNPLQKYLWGGCASGRCCLSADREVEAGFRSLHGLSGESFECFSLKFTGNLGFVSSNSVTGGVWRLMVSSEGLEAFLRASPSGGG